MTASQRLAVVLFNLGGPDQLASVKPFLFNLFNDKAIIGLPALLRWPLAKFISARREKEAQHIYAQIGGGSPLLPNTRAQESALQNLLQAQHPDAAIRCFTAMRYWHPRSDAVVKEVKEFAPTQIIFLPLYPQFSTTTTQSSLDDFSAAMRREGLSEKLLRQICCYPRQQGLVEAYAAIIKPLYEKMLGEARAKTIPKAPRILFSAHGLPEKTIKAGDPYQWQIGETTRAVVAALNIPNLDWRNSYQSRVGPLKWIEPYTDAEIIAAGRDGVPLLIVPIAFVSEHSETLYEIEQLYRKLAAENGVPLYERVPAVATHPAFINGLAALVSQALTRDHVNHAPEGGKRICAKSFDKCPCKN